MRILTLLRLIFSGEHTAPRVAIGALADGIPIASEGAVGEGANRRTRGRVRSPDCAGNGSSVKMRPRGFVIAPLPCNAREMDL